MKIDKYSHVLQGRVQDFLNGGGPISWFRKKGHQILRGGILNSLIGVGGSSALVSLGRQILLI